MYKNLSKQQLIDISGGHNGTAYEIGHTVGEVITKVGVVLGVIAYFLTPKGS